MIRRFCIVVYFMISQFCFSEELTREQLIQGTNMSRELIASGEMRVIVTRHHPAQKSPEEIQAWMEAEKEKILKEYSGTNQEDERQQELDSLDFDAMWYEERQEIEEIEVAFRILDRQSVSYPKTYQYKMTMIDRREDIPPYSNELGYFQILAYDGQTQVHEELDGFPAPSVAFFKKDYYAGFIHFQVYGRSYLRVPSDAKLVGRETVAEADCYVLEFNRKKIWVDAQKQFCIRKREGTDERRQPPVIWESVYEDFQQYGDIWFPAVSRWTAKRAGKVKQVNMMVVKEAQFNLDFPPNFFQVDPKSYLERGLIPRISTWTKLNLYFSPQLFGPQSVTSVV